MLNLKKAAVLLDTGSLLCDFQDRDEWTLAIQQQIRSILLQNDSNKSKVCIVCLNKFTSLHTHTRLTALFPGLPGWAGTRKVKPIWILLKQVTVSGSGISWAICKSASRSRQITTPAPHHSVFYRPCALPAAQPTASKHWRHDIIKPIYY